MAQMIPKIFVNNNKRYNAERDVYKMFEKATSDGADEWVVRHSLDISYAFGEVAYGNKTKSEIDFLVLAPNLGIIALEVKGGEILIRDGIWCRKNRKTNDYEELKENPFKQVEDNIHVLEKKYKKQYGHFPFFTYGVMFPDCNYQLENEFSCEQWKIFDKRDGKDIISYIKRLIDKAKKLHISAGHPYFPPTKKDIENIIEKLGLNKKDIPYSEWVKQIEESQEKFSEDQLQAIYNAISHDRCLIEGYTGTGKTLIAIKIVKESLKNGERIAFFCYNSILGKYLKSQLPENEHFFVGHIHKFLLEKIKEAKLKLLMPSGKDYFEELRKIDDNSQIKFPEEVVNNDFFWEDVVPKKALEALKQFPVEYDKLVIDEAQDIFVYSYFDILGIILKGGTNKGKWCFFADPGQDISKKTYGIPYDEALEWLGQQNNDYWRPKKPLSTNWRNSKKITKAISKLVKHDSSLVTKDEIEDGPGVEYSQWSTLEEQKSNIEKSLDYLLKKGNIRPNQITLLTTFDPHQEVNPSWYKKSVISQLKKDYKLTEYKQGLDNITYSSISSFKGMENSVIFIVDVETYNDINLLYVGMSRARSILKIFEYKQAEKERKQLRK